MTVSSRRTVLVQFCFDHHHSFVPTTTTITTTTAITDTRTAASKTAGTTINALLHCQQTHLLRIRKGEGGSNGELPGRIPDFLDACFLLPQMRQLLFRNVDARLGRGRERAGEEGEREREVRVRGGRKRDGEGEGAQA